MDSNKDSGIQEEFTKGASNDSTLNPGSSTEGIEDNACLDHHTSCPAILEPSEYDPLFKRETIRKPLKTYKAIMRSFTSTEVYRDSDELSNGRESGRRTGGSGSRCFDLFKRYKNFAVKVRKSKLIYILQILLMLLSFSATVMGMEYVDSCPASPSLSVLAMLTGVFGILLIGQWMAIQWCHPDDRPCDGQQRLLILLFSVLVSVMLELEIYLFSKLSFSFEPSTINYCSKVFYDYTYYKFIAAFGSMFLVVLLYFPNYRSLASGVVCSDPLAASCYLERMEEAI
ncbi:uncharacterized protein LOC129957409 [Argiope bruennichi]|uniref:uncharacterized protein LOC129957409 n=1 Tax=Argiope bruennichi TaxID=94029 RepID=UPI0024953EF3|nr:uncharacterized protein LOC129957409 [Argiope bruennichi]